MNRNEELAEILAPEQAPGGPRGVLQASTTPSLVRAP